jgi:hypothetical protein
VHSNPVHLGTSHPMYQDQGFFAGTQITHPQGDVMGVLALHAPHGHRLSAEEAALLERLGHELRTQAKALERSTGLVTQDTVTGEDGWVENLGVQA